MPASQLLLLGHTGPLHRGRVGGGGHQPKVGAPGGGGVGVGGGGGPPAAGGRGGGGAEVREGRLCSHPSARRSASRATSCRRSRWGPGGRGGGRLATGRWPRPRPAPAVGPPDVSEPGEESVHLGAHLPPGR